MKVSWEDRPASLKITAIKNSLSLHEIIKTHHYSKARVRKKGHPNLDLRQEVETIGIFSTDPNASPKAVILNKIIFSFSKLPLDIYNMVSFL